MPAPISSTSGPREPRRCRHVNAIHPVELRSTGCSECLQLGADWMELSLCLSCGWVACSDDSPHRHAMAHYEETDHPIAMPVRPDGWPWCYVHQRRVTLV